MPDCYNHRFDPNFKKVRQMFDDVKVGEVQILPLTFRDPSPRPAEYVKVSGGIFLDMTIHDFDIARYLSGRKIVEVYPAVSVMIDPTIGEAGDIDTTINALKFNNGSTGIIDNCRKAVHGYDQRVEVFGSEDIAAVVNNTPDLSVFSNADGVVSKKPLLKNRPTRLSEIEKSLLNPKTCEKFITIIKGSRNNKVRAFPLKR